VTGTSADPAAIAASLPDEDLVGQVLMPEVDMSGPTQAALAVLRDSRACGVILMGHTTPDQVRALTEALQAARPALSRGGPPLLISTDQEYGVVTRIRTGVVQLPAAMAFGAAGRPELTEAAWSAAGQELAAMGINIDNAPVADVIGPAGNRLIGSRSYGADPAAVSVQVAAAVRGLQSAGVAATLKHFPGHGNTTVDSHADLPVLSQPRSVLEATDLPPFRAGITAGAKLVMAGHLDIGAIDGGIPATFSSRVLVDLLRGELGFTGVVVSDAMDMAPARRWPAGEAAVRAILGGNDLLLMPPSVGDARAGLLEAVRSGRLPRERLVASVTRILALRAELSANPTPDMSTVGAASHEEAALAVASAAVSVLSGPHGAGSVTGPVRISTSNGRDQQGRWLAEELSATGVPVVDSGGTLVHLMGYGDGDRELVADAGVTVAMDTPYVLADAGSPVKVATYSSTRVAMRALAAVLSGRAPAPGRSPVPVAGLPASVRVR
jgi:beta-N-acetylhexosaminidase